MNILIEIHYDIRGSKGLRRGEFTVNKYRYLQDPFQEVINVTKKWIYQLELESPEMKIEKIIYNREHDITELVIKEMRYFNDDLPF